MWQKATEEVYDTEKAVELELPFFVVDAFVKLLLDLLVVSYRAHLLEIRRI